MSLPAEFLSEMLQLIRRFFFARATDKQFFQERPMLEKAITWPAEWLKRRGINRWQLSRYRKVIMTVIETIRQHGNREKIGRFSVYFLHCVQKHMDHHGEGYYDDAKAPRSIGSLIDPALRRMAAAQPPPDTTIEVLSAVHRALTRRRIRKQKTASESDLFTSCKAPAVAVQKRGKVPQTFAKPRKFARDSSNQPSPRPAIRN